MFVMMVAVVFFGFFWSWGEGVDLAGEGEDEVLDLGSVWGDVEGFDFQEVINGFEGFFEILFSIF